MVMENEKKKQKCAVEGRGESNKRRECTSDVKEE